MANEKKPPLIKVMTEKGIARFPSLTKPDTKFAPEGEYKVGVILSTEAAQKIIDRITQEASKIYEATKEELKESIKTLKGEKLVKAKKALAELKLGDMPFKPVYDEDGNETGEVVLNFKMKATRKDKEGKTIKMAPKLFDSKGNPLKLDKDIWGGSVIKVAGSLNPFYIPGTNTCGVGIRLAAVQVIELRSADGGDASAYGFGKEDGYEAPQSEGEQEGFSNEDPEGSDGAPTEADDF